MKIGIISDSHKKLGRAKKGIDFLIQQGAEYIIHAGDIVRVELLEYLESTGLVYLAVYGNNDRHLFDFHDDFNLVQEPYYFKIKNRTFKLMHHPYFITPDVDIVIYGHTHISHIQMKEGTLFINPGEISARDKPISTVALLEVTDEEYLIKLFEREIGEKSWSQKEYNYHYQRGKESNVKPN